MNIADIPVGIDDAIHGHAPELEEIDLLPVHLCNTIVRVRHSDKWDALPLPIPLEGLKGIWTHCKKFCPTIDKACICIAKARQLRAAMRSEKTAQKGKQDGLLFIVC